MLRLIPGTFIGTSIVRKKTPRYPPLKKRNGSGVAQSEFEKVDEFNGQFTVVFTKTEHKQVFLSFFLYVLTPEGDVRRVFRYTKC